MYKFNCTYGEIETIAIDMNELRDRIKKFESKYPAPVPPMVAPEYYRENREEMYAIKNELKISRAKAIEEWRNRQEKVPNHNDKEYVAKLKQHEKILYWYMLKQVILMGILVDGVELEKYLLKGGTEIGIIHNVMHDPKVAYELYQFITGNSELSNNSITKQIELLDVKWNDMPILDAIKMLPKGKTSSSWVATGLIAAKGMGSFREFDDMSITEQSRLIAVYLVDNWLKALAAKEASDNARNNRNNKQVNRH